MSETPSLTSAPASPGAHFGWQVALVDAGAIALIVGGGALTSTATGFAILPAIGGALYFAGGPLTHTLHHDQGGAWRSVLLRVGIPIASAGVTAGLSALMTSGGQSDVCYPHDQRTCAALFGGLVGFGAGMIGAMVADWVTARAPEPKAPQSMAWTVLALPLPGGIRFGVAGEF
jgi:hypothetical protein